jgi:hypothetical protein
MELQENETGMHIKHLYSGLSVNEKISLLSLLAHEITVFARGAYPSQEQAMGDTQRLVTFNELQHNITSQLGKMLAKDEGRYPDDVFIDILFSKARNGGAEEDMVSAFKFAFKYFERIT